MSDPSFKQMMNDVVDWGSCCECGTCVLVCPHNIIEYIDSKPKQTAKASADFDFCGISEGIGCDVCAQVCPRLGPREFNLHDEVFADQKGTMYRGVFGDYQEIYAARALDPRILEVCQDGGVVTALLAYGLDNGLFDGACVSAPDPERPCSPRPVCVTSSEEAIGAAGSWYTYCPNDLALADAVEAGCERVAFVGVPCQVTPVRKGQLKPLGFLETERKKPKHIERQAASLKDPMSRVVLQIGLLCSEVFDFAGLMQGKIEGELGIPLEDVKKFNVKGEVLVYLKNGSLVTIDLKDAQEHARPECHHCGDFSAEVADISCGGVGAMDWTIVIVRTDAGREIMDKMKAAGLLKLRPIEEFENSLKVLMRLARRQHQRVPEGADGLPAVRPPYFLPPREGSQPG
ncbi:MAG: Coenzyme F420 hydrogenase/dehydrogenase, beta subunit C-terminal domain [Deltaproteobacteria bacterium]